MLKLENGLVEFSFDRKTGSLLQITDIRTGKVFLSIPQGARLFRLMIPTEEWRSRYVDSHECSQPAMELNGDTLQITFANVPCKGMPTGINVAVTICLPAKSPEAFFSLHLENGCDVDIQEVRFPWVGGFTAIAGPGRDEIIIASQRLDPHNFLPQVNPHTFARWRERKIFEYPFPLLLPYLDISGGGSGIGYICYLEKIRYGVMGFERLDPFGDKPSLSWSWAGSPFVKPGQSWKSPTVGIFVHDGDWHRTADRFRTWVQGWWKNPNPPVALKHSVGLVNLTTTSFDGTEFFKFSDLPELAKECIDSGLTHICLWHKTGGLYCNKGDYREIMDEPRETLSELKNALAEIKKMGGMMSLILNMRLVRDSMAVYPRLGESEAMRTLDGSAYVALHWASHYHLCEAGPAYEEGHCVALCQRPNSLFARRAREVIAKMLELGFTSIFIDQPINISCCLADHHRHPSPDQAPEGATEWMKEVSMMAKERSPEAYIIGELPELFQTQQVDLWWYWPWRYLKPEVYRYSMPDSLQLWVIDGDVGELNRAFALGFYANLTPAGLEGRLSDRPAVARQCALLAKLRTGTAAWTVDARFVDQQGLTLPGPDTACAYVYVGDQKASVIIAETGGRETTVKLTFDPSQLKMRFERSGQIHSLNGTKSPGSLPTNGVHKLERKLSPYDICVWTFDNP